jgi:uncharacterized protein YcfL
MKKILILSFLLFSLIGCTQKQVVFKDRLICNDQVTVQRINADIRINKADKEVAIKYKESVDSAFEHYENQVEVNNEMCKGLEDEN